MIKKIRAAVLYMDKKCNQFMKLESVVHSGTGRGLAKHDRSSLLVIDVSINSFTTSTEFQLGPVPPALMPSLS